MPGYGTLDAKQGSGLLPWSWARERLQRSHDYWVATVRPDGHPHVMPVWGVWIDDALWFSSSRGSRKTRNLRANAHCTIATDNAYEPVVIEGEAVLIDELAPIGAFVAETNRKYKTDYSVDFFNRTDNACFKVVPTLAFGLTESDFTGSPTRWVFGR
jgi:PPOX class probable F420-dependent enzyme